MPINILCIQKQLNHTFLWWPGCVPLLARKNIWKLAPFLIPWTRMWSRDWVCIQIFEKEEELAKAVFLPPSRAKRIKKCYKIEEGSLFYVIPFSFKLYCIQTTIWGAVNTGHRKSRQQDVSDSSRQTLFLFISPEKNC